MKKILVIGLISFTVFSIFAQPNLVVSTNDIVIGRNFKTNSDIKAKEYVFADRINSWYLDNSTNLLTLQFRAKGIMGIDQDFIGSIAMFDLSTEQVLWDKKINFQESRLDQYENVLIQTTGFQSSCLNNKDGKSLWKVRNVIKFVDPLYGVGLGYKCTLLGGLTNTLEGIDLITGKSLWNREIYWDYGLNDVFPLNDSVILFVANGLHAVNLRTGSGWDYNARTGKKDYAGTVLTNIFNLTFSILSGSSFEVETGHDLLTDVVSNVIVDNTGIYMASMESIVRFDFSGHVIWKRDLPKKYVSQSNIFIKDSLLCMINNGCAYFNSQLIAYGKPFISAYNINSGNRVYLNAISNDNEKINGYEIQKDTILLLLGDRTFKYSLITGLSSANQIFDKQFYGEFIRFVGMDVYIKSDSTLVNLILSDTTKHYILTNTNRVLMLNNQLELVKFIPFEQLYFNYLTTADCKFMANGKRTTVVDNANNVVAELYVSDGAVVNGPKLYDARENSFVQVDLNAVLQFVPK
jgi:hypothetical protein